MKPGELFDKLRSVQGQFMEAQEALAKASVVGESGAGLVKVTLNGNHQALSVELAPALLQEERSVVEDLIASAITDAARRLQELQQERLGEMARAAGLPVGWPGGGGGPTGL